MRDLKHNFALYVAHLNISKTSKLVITDQDLVHRVYKVLRLEVGDELTLFGSKQAVIGKIGVIDKKQLVLDQLNWQDLTALKPAITVALGVLKKENFENALYSCVELGATAILPIMFAKSVPGKLNQERVDKILISAAEQSKNFNLPVWHDPVTFEQFLVQIKKSTYHKTAYIFCDINGKPMLPLISQLKTQNYDQVVLIIGPEGDLTSAEHSQLLAQDVFAMQLTPTVLRSFQAVTVALGSLRSLL